MKRIQINCLLGVALALLWGGCSSDPEVTDPVVIEVGTRQVTLSELQAQIDSLKHSGSMLPEDSELFMERYIERQVAVAKAMELGLDKDPEFQRQWENLLIGRLEQKLVQTESVTLSVSSEEVAEYYQSQIASYTTPAQVHVALLFLPVQKYMDVSAREALKARLEKARELAMDLPADTRGFGAMASQYSEEGTSRFKGGDIGWLQAGAGSYRWPSVVIDSAFTLAENGARSEVIEADDGYYLLKLLGSRPEKIRALDASLEASIQKKLYHKKRAAVQVSVRKDWGDSVPVIRHSEYFSHLDLTPQAATSLSAAQPPLLPRP